MIDQLTEQRDAIAAICRRYGVRRLEVFGSAARGDWVSGRSDIDLIYAFDDTGIGVAARYFGLIEDLETLFGQPVEILTDTERTNPLLWAEIDRDRQTLFDDRQTLFHVEA